MVNEDCKNAGRVKRVFGLLLKDKKINAANSTYEFEFYSFSLTKVNNCFFIALRGLPLLNNTGFN